MSQDTPNDSPPVRLEPGTRVACVVSGYHPEITGAMAASARETLLAAGLAEREWIEIPAPGAFELPILAQRLAGKRNVDCVLCFGLVLKGETEHDRHIAGAVADGLMRVGLEARTPVLFGVLTCATLEQAERRARRASEDGLDKGREVALAACRVLASLRRSDEVSR